MSFRVTCEGPRGSIPAPSRKNFSTVEFGGNTSCYYVEAGAFRIIIDHGSGVRLLGDRLMAEGQVGKHFISLSSHGHWDHIQGLPFCIPYFIKSNTFHFHGHIPPGHETSGNLDHLSNTVEKLLAEQQASPHFPVAHHSLPSKRHYQAHARLFSETFWYYVAEDGSYELVADQMLGMVKETLPVSIKMDPKRWIKITTIPVNHPDGCLAYRIDYMGDSIVYASDHEPGRFPWDALNRLAKGATLLIIDGQYPEVLLARACQGFGHGSPQSCIEQAKSCEALEVAVHHFDPKSSDDILRAMEQEAIAYAVQIGYKGRVCFAREEQVWEIG